MPRAPAISADPQDAPPAGERLGVADHAAELFVRIKSMPSSTEVLIQVLQLAAAEVGRGAGAVRHAAREIAGGIDHTRAGRPTIDDASALLRVSALVARGWQRAAAIRKAAAETCEGDTRRTEAMIRRLRGKGQDF